MNMNTMNTITPPPTPETDAATFKILSSLQSGTEKVVHAEICAKLERELNEARDQLNAMREAIKDGYEALDWATSNMNPPFAWEPFKKANAALTKLQPFIAP